MYKGDTLYRCSEERIKERLSAFTDSTEAVTDTFIGQMRRLGADIISDDLGNIYATVPGYDADEKKIVLSCPDASDSACICTVSEVMETIVSADIPHRHALTVLLWNGESSDKNLVPAMGLLCRDYLPDEVKKDYCGKMTTPTGTGGSENRLNTRDYRFMFEVHTSKAAKDKIGIADMISAARNKKRAGLRYNEKLTGLAMNCAALCKADHDLVHFVHERDIWIASHMMPTAVILVGAPDVKLYKKASDILLMTLMQADRI